MKTLALICMLSIALCASSSMVAAYDVNKDLTNEGPAAHDLTVILYGERDVTKHYDGYHSGSKKGWFDSFAWGPDGSNTKLVWSTFKDEVNDTIDNGQTIHVGWSTDPGGDKSDIKDMYWTDENGDRLENSVVYNEDTGWTYESPCSVSWSNVFVPDPSYGSAQTLSITNVYFAVFGTPIPLENLNSENTTLSNALQALPGGASLNVDPGTEFTLPIPGTVNPGDAVVVRYEVYAPGTMASTIDYVQYVAQEKIPTLNQWGLITLFLLLLAAGIFVVRQRRRAAAL